MDAVLSKQCSEKCESEQMKACKASSASVTAKGRNSKCLIGIVLNLIFLCVCVLYVFNKQVENV